jgi:hypothetical protein
VIFCDTATDSAVIDEPSWLALIDEMSIHQVEGRIEILNRDLARFWSAAHGWAPPEAAGLLSKSRLDWQVSLSASLRQLSDTVER